MADDMLDEVQVSGRNRNPGLLQRIKRAKVTFAGGTFLPRVQAALRPELFRERGDTNALVDDALADDGPLARLAASNPELVHELRQQANTPMQPREHEKFRSALLGLVGQEVEREGKVRATLLDNGAFMEAFSALDGSIPGINDPDQQTLEESERRQIQILFDKAQQLAPLDPEASKSVMAEVRKKADLLTANVRQFMEKNRRDAQLEDRQLYGMADEQVQETDDIIKSLRDDMDEKGMLREPHPAIIARAFAALGRAGDLPASGFSEAAASAGERVGALAGADSTQGNILQTAIELGGKALDKLKQGKDVEYLIKRLEFNKNLVQQGYLKNREQLKQRYAPLGIAIGDEPGDARAVVHDAYKAEADKIPAKGSTPESDAQDRESALRTMLNDELRGADEEVKKHQPDAAANLPGAAARLARALARQSNARDDVALFEDDLRQQRGGEVPAIEGIKPADVEAAIKGARARRQARTEASTRSAVRSAIQQSLRSFTR